MKKKKSKLKIVLISLIFFLIAGFLYYKINYCSNDIIKNPLAFLQTIFIGLIAFSIPFLWNAHQRLSEKKEKIYGDKIENILAREYYIKGINEFEVKIQYPFAISILLGLFIIPLFHLNIALFILLLFFLYYLFLPKIYDDIEDKTKINLKQYFKKDDIQSDELEKIFLELWQNGDDFIEKEYKLTSIEIFTDFAQQILRLSNNNELKTINTLVNQYIDNLDKRITDYRFLRNILPELLNIHHKCYMKGKNLPSNDDDEFIIDDIVRVIDSLIEQIYNRILNKQNQSLNYILFNQLKVHLKKTDIINNDKYISNLLNVILTRVIFNNITEAFKCYDVLERFFPVQWKITKENWEKHKICKIVFYKFRLWAFERINYIHEDDSKLEFIDLSLFPETDPMIWAPILIFTSFGYNINVDIKFIIRKTNWTFGEMSRPSAGHYENKADIEKQIIENQERIKNNTFDLTLLIFKDWFTVEKIKSYIEDLEFLKKEYESDNKLNNRRERLLAIFKDMLNYINREKNK